MPETLDPFDALRLPATPLAPRPAFAAELRSRLAAALSPTDSEPTTRPPQETPMSDTATQATAPALVPYLAVAGAAAAIDWYRDVLGAIETLRFVGDDGRVGHAELTIGTAKIMLADEFPEIDVTGPATLGGTTVALHLEVVDVDYSYRRAVDAGATSLREPADQGHGSRNATIVDPFGHRWMLSQPIDADRAAAATEETGVGGNGADWEVSGRHPVEPGYLTLHTPDLALARTFYGALFDWDVADGSVEGGGHIENTHFPMGLAPMNDEVGQGATIYFRVDDLGPYAAKVTELGGQVLEVNDYPSGGNASCTDDQGRRFDLFRPNPGY
ncbi:MAG: VOC family protein [Acidimicrobiales bacterium]